MAALCCECQTSCVSAALTLAPRPVSTVTHLWCGHANSHQSASSHNKWCWRPPAASLLSIKNTLKTYLHN